MNASCPTRRLASLVIDRRWWVIAAWGMAVVMLRLAAPPWSGVARDGDLDQLPAETATARGEKLSAAAFPGDLSKSQFVLVFARQGQSLTIADRDCAIHLGHRIAGTEGLNVVDVWSEKTPVIGSSLRSRSGQAVRLVVRLTNEFMATENIRLLAELQKIVREAQDAAPAGLEIGISGSAAVGGDMLSAAAESVESTHVTTLLLVAVLLTVIYRSPWLVIVPMAAIGIATTVSMDLLALLAEWSRQHPEVWPQVQVFTTTKIFIIVLLFGSGTDYCLFLTARYREERAVGQMQREALAISLTQVGIALVASALTTIVGLAMMGFAQFGKFSYSGPSIAVCLAVTLLACLTLVPALLATRLGLVIERGRQATRSGRWQGGWERLADLILRRPGTVLLVSVLVALPLAWYGWQTPTTYDFLGELGRNRVSRRGTDMLRTYFPPGEIGPLVVLAQAPEGGLDSLDGQFQIAELVKQLVDVPGVAEVRSLYQPLGDPPGTVRLFSGTGLEALATRGSPLTKAVFVSDSGNYAGNVTRLFLILTAQPFSPAAVTTCDAVEEVLNRVTSDPQSPWHDAKFALSGPTVGIRDLETITLADRTRIEYLVTLAVFLVILILLRRPRICLYLILTVILSYLVTMGISNLAFQTWRGGEYVGLDWKVPLFLFVILVAVGQDYNIYLVTRVLEEQRTSSPRAGLRQAMLQTGGIITSCGVIMAGTFVSMTTSQLNGMVELGFALTLGILLDTFVVRTIIVPAFLAVLAGREHPLTASSLAEH